MITLQDITNDPHFPALVAAYFLPTIIALLRFRLHSALVIFVLNALAAWTVLGWLMLLLWATAPQQGGVGGFAGLTVGVVAVCMLWIGGSIHQDTDWAAIAEMLPTSRIESTKIEPITATPTPAPEAAAPITPVTPIETAAAAPQDVKAVAQDAKRPRAKAKDWPVCNGVATKGIFWDTRERPLKPVTKPWRFRIVTHDGEVSGPIDYFPVFDNTDVMVTGHCVRGNSAAFRIDTITEIDPPWLEKKR
jgi:Superinfection immunity protein